MVQGHARPTSPELGLDHCVSARASGPLLGFQPIFFLGRMHFWPTGFDDFLNLGRVFETGKTTWEEGKSPTGTVPNHFCKIKEPEGPFLMFSQVPFLALRPSRAAIVHPLLLVSCPDSFLHVTRDKGAQQNIEKASLQVAAYDCLSTDHAWTLA